MDLLDSVLDCIRYTPMDILLDTDIERWKQISGYPNYVVSNFGKVKNTKTGVILKPSSTSYGYYIVDLCEGGKAKTHYIHRLIAEYFIPNPDNKKIVDHINGDPKDNRLSNLRWCSHKENSRNTKTQKNNISGFKGVCFHKGTQKYQASIQVNGKTKYLGLFGDPEDAAKKYNEAAIKYFKEFARVNIIK